VTTEEKYVLAAYLVVLAGVLLWLVIYAFRMTRMQREIGELAELAEQRRAGEPRPSPPPDRER
jgi:HAMP domain-containing protein